MVTFWSSVYYHNECRSIKKKNVERQPSLQPPSTRCWKLWRQRRKWFLPRKRSSQAGQGTEFSQEEHLKSLGHALLMKPRNATRPSSMLWSINTKKTEIQKTWLVLKPRTLFFLFTEKSWEKFSWNIYRGCVQWARVPLSENWWKPKRSLKIPKDLIGLNRQN